MDSLVFASLLGVFVSKMTDPTLLVAAYLSYVVAKGKVIGFRIAIIMGMGLIFILPLAAWMPGTTTLAGTTIGTMFRFTAYLTGYLVYLGLVFFIASIRKSYKEKAK